MAGSVDRKSPVSWRAGVAQPAQLEHFAVGQDAVDVGEACALAHAYLAQLRPTFAGAIDQPVMQGDLRRVRDLRHLPIVAQPSDAVWVATACRVRDETRRGGQRMHGFRLYLLGRSRFAGAVGGWTRGQVGTTELRCRLRASVAQTPD